MSQNTVKTSKIQIIDNEGNVAKEVYLSGGALTIDGQKITTETLVKTLAAAHAVSALVRTDIPGFSFPVVAGKKYKINLWGTYTTGATSAGGSMGFVLADSAEGTIAGLFTGTITNGSASSATHQAITTVNSTASTAGSNITTPSANAAAQAIVATAVFTCTVSGTFKVQWGTEEDTVAATLAAGAILEVTELN